jgi:predicted phage terminase large subunit-like protein
MTDSQYATKWNAFVRMVLSGTLINKRESPEVIRSRKERLEANPEEWFSYYFRKFAFAEPAMFQTDAATRVLTNPEWCEVRMWSRELAKSTRTMMEVFYLAFVGHLPCTGQQEKSCKDGAGNVASRKTKKCVLLISNSLDNATRLLMPYKSNLEHNHRLLHDYGMQRADAIWSATEFITAGGISFRAVGVGQSPRGTRNEEVRPDIILFDDLDTDADCLNGEIVARKWHWIEEAAIGTRSVSEPTTIIFCGNRIAVDSCIARAEDIADHTSVVNIRDEHGHSAWPQKNSETDIDRVLSQKSYAAQQKEYFNNPITEGSVFKEMAYKPARPLAEYEVLLCYTDPSYKATNDYKATVLVGRWKGEYHVLKCYLEQATTAQMIDWHCRIMNYVGDRACYYYMEEVFMQDVIVKEVSEAGKRMGRTIPIRGDTRRKPDKYMRIESLLEPMVRNEELYLNEEEKHNLHMQRLATQFTAFAAGSAAHDDGPDAVEGAVWLINDKFGAKDTSGIVMSGRARNSKW